MIEVLSDYTFDLNDNTYSITRENIDYEKYGDYSFTNILRHFRNGLTMD